ncbi:MULTISPECIES: site-2 protease family protein [Pusillimonas]|uniref:site-2 protease family protein n=1 Tax=Pusillimonas TaxID=305976 RepID=UPI000E5A075C|nr:MULTISPECIES: site-2 protease family protein [Pusillimonas]MDX3894189.1 site-2 protease family protein [Pusillimonas sp.]TFL14278.1 site-2 protease family protein [Pusillimonas caeni]
MDSLIQTIAVYALPVLFGITLHEAAHGYVARMFGDPTAYEAGRISLNPIRHVDPIGTIAVPLFLLFSTKLLGGAGILFGWAKPVPVDWGRLRNPKRDMLWVALAGPASNLVMGVIWAISLRLLILNGASPDDFWVLMAFAGIQINLVLMALNLFPLPPLDGGRIVFSLLPSRLAWKYGKLEPYGLLILIVLMLTGVLWMLLRPLLAFGQAIITWFL